MAFDELLVENVGTLKGWVLGTFQRWAAAGLKIRAQNYKPTEFWDHLQEQVLDNWDTWKELTNFSGFPVTPTIVIRGALNSMNGLTGEAYVHQHLDVGAITATTLEEFGGANTIGTGSFSVGPAGDLKGKVVAKMTAEPANKGLYRGVVLFKKPGEPAALPLAWLLVNVE